MSFVIINRKINNMFVLMNLIFKKKNFLFADKGREMGSI